MKRNPMDTTTATLEHPVAPIPAITELATLPQWVLWRYQERDGKKVKLPYQLNGRLAKTNDPATWSTYQGCLEGLAQPGDYGLGFVFSDDDPYVGIDLDACLYPDGSVAWWAKPYLAQFSSYAEVSPSGTGIKIIIKGKLPERCKSSITIDAEAIGGKSPGVEVYQRARYFTITGAVWKGRDTIRDDQPALDNLLLGAGFIKLASLPQAGHTNGAHPVGNRSPKSEGEWAATYLARLSSHRASGYSDWLAVGCCLRSLGAEGLALWDSWSRQSDKYSEGDCSRRWEGLPSDDAGIAKLGAWANEDDPGGKSQWQGKGRGAAAAARNGDDQAAARNEAVQAATEPKYGRFETRLAIALKENGVLANEFARNTLTQKLEYSGQPINDDDLARYQLIAKDAGIRDRAGVLDALAVWAARNAYNPIQQYLEGLPQWDGQDHIAQLAAYFHCENPDFQYDDDTSEGYFELLLRKWLIGAVQRAYGICQNPMLVLVGAQGIGKSYLARWLGSDLPAYHTESAIQPDNKDNQILATQKWVWEVAELEGTTRRADVSALKAFLTKAHSDVRLPYARTAIQQPMLASYIGSLNQGDYLTDETGNRRFWNVSITAIDRAYSREMLPSQVWAQAYALWQAGETNALLAGEAAWVEAQGRERYTKETGYESYISRFFTLASDGEGMDGNQIAEHINDQIKYQVVFPKDVASGNLKRALIACGYTQTHKRVGGRLGRFWNCAPGDGCNNRYNPVTTLVTPIQRITKPNIPGCYNVTTKKTKLIGSAYYDTHGDAHTNIKVSDNGLLHPETPTFQGTTKPNEGVTTLVTSPCNTPGRASRQEMLAFLRAHTDIPSALYPTYTDEELAGFVEAAQHPDDDDDDDDPDDDGPTSDAAPNVPGNPPPTNGDGPASDAAPNGNGNDEQRWWGGKPIISDKRLALLGRLPAHISSLGKTDEELERLIWEAAQGK